MIKVTTTPFNKNEHKYPLTELLEIIHSYVYQVYSKETYHLIISDINMFTHKWCEKLGIRFYDKYNFRFVVTFNEVTLTLSVKPANMFTACLLAGQYMRRSQTKANFIEFDDGGSIRYIEDSDFYEFNLKQI